MRGEKKEKEADIYVSINLILISIISRFFFFLNFYVCRINACIKSESI